MLFQRPRKVLFIAFSAVLCVNFTLLTPNAEASEISGTHLFDANNSTLVDEDQVAMAKAAEISITKIMHQALNHLLSQDQTILLAENSLSQQQNPNSNFGHEVLLEKLQLSEVSQVPLKNRSDSSSVIPAVALAIESGNPQNATAKVTQKLAESSKLNSKNVSQTQQNLENPSYLETLNTAISHLNTAINNLNVAIATSLKNVEKVQVATKTASKVTAPSTTLPTAPSDLSTVNQATTAKNHSVKQSPVASWRGKKPQALQAPSLDELLKRKNWRIEGSIAGILIDRKRYRANTENANGEWVRGDYNKILDHISGMAEINAYNRFFDFGIYGTFDLKNKKLLGDYQDYDPPHEYNFINGNPYNYGEYKWEGTGGETDLVRRKESDGISISKAAFKFENPLFYFRTGIFQPSVPGGLGVNTSLAKGAYQGAEAEFKAQSLSFGLTEVVRYKAPWYKKFYNFSDNDNAERRNSSQRIPQIRSYGVVYDNKHLIKVDIAKTVAGDFRDMMHYKISRNNLALASGLFDISYHLYKVKDGDGYNADTDIDGTAQQKVLALGYQYHTWHLRYARMDTKAKGIGYFAYRPTVPYGSSQGAYDEDWELGSDFSVNGEVANMIAVDYDLRNLGLEGWLVGLSYAKSKDGEGVTNVADYSSKSKAVDLKYRFSQGFFEGGFIKLRYIDFDNQTPEASWGKGFDTFPGAHQSEKIIKVVMQVPYLVH